ncbi:MAG: hypothetical protein M1821_003796 [Bathelium mastoideum]|nr:MAG: hypothetical protein M1821_003796 [Bathelium mastoideum]
MGQALPKLQLARSEAVSIKTHYETLGVTKTATDVEIRTAYKSLALEYHPDRNRDEEATARFCAIQEAYEVLHDPERREIYDRTLDHTSDRENRPYGPHHGGTEQFERRSHKRRRSTSSEDAEAKAEIDPFWHPCPPKPKRFHGPKGRHHDESVGLRPRQPVNQSDCYSARSANHVVPEHAIRFSRSKEWAETKRAEELKRREMMKKLPPRRWNPKGTNMEFWRQYTAEYDIYGNEVEYPETPLDYLRSHPSTGLPWDEIKSQRHPGFW